LIAEGIGSISEEWAGSYCVKEGTNVQPEDIRNAPCANGSCGDPDDYSADALGVEASDDGPDPSLTVFVDRLVQSSVDKVDLVFVVDNSQDMEAAQRLLADAVPEFIGQLASPPCVDAATNVVAIPPSAVEPCPQGSARRFQPIDDVHAAVITTSLGGYGAADTCVSNDTPGSEQTVDMARLLGSLPRGGSAAPDAAATGFLSWTQSSQRGAFDTAAADLINSAGTVGCGWEAPLEAWYRFLIDPYPYTQVVRQPCNASDSNNLCAGPETDSSGNLLVDAVILDQRAQFLRPDSLLAIVMLSDENDCSFINDGQQWRLSQIVDESGALQPAFKAAAACDDPDFGPNHECCHSCGAPPPSGCPTETDGNGQTVGAGCGESRYYEDTALDHPNLRCFEQKRRFGVDYLFPVERYSNALTLSQICPFAKDLDPTSEACADGAGIVANPLYVDLSHDPNAEGSPGAPPRSKQLIYLSGLVGVPWQDLAIDPNPDSALRYRVNRPDASDEQRVDWSLILGDRNPPVFPDPRDPLMLESVEPRGGTQPVTGEVIGTSASNAINGSEWNILDGGELQYACTAPLAEHVDCPSIEEVEERLSAGEPVPPCVCTSYGEAEYGNPLCDGLTKTHLGARPGIRQLQAMYDFGLNSVPASICPKSIDPSAGDYGYRPWADAMLNRVSEQLQERCLGRPLPVTEDAQGQLIAGCSVLEALPPGEDCSNARSPVSNAELALVHQELLQSYACADEADCAEYTVCKITQLTPDVDRDGYVTCLNSEIASGDGWCYVGPAQGLGAPDLVERCPASARQKVRFIGEGQPARNSVAVLACAGSTL
jgi:hypothetical protein